MTLYAEKQYFCTHKAITYNTEVLTAQKSLLSAQLSEAMNIYNGAQAVIALYIALGGATK